MISFWRKHEQRHFNFGFGILCNQCISGAGGDPLSAQAESGADGADGRAGESSEEKRNTHNGGYSDTDERGGYLPSLCEGLSGHYSGAVSHAWLWAGGISGRLYQGGSQAVYGTSGMAEVCPAVFGDGCFCILPAKVYGRLAGDESAFFRRRLSGLRMGEYSDSLFCGDWDGERHKLYGWPGWPGQLSDSACCDLLYGGGDRDGQWD